MQAEVERSNRRFQRFFGLINVIWVIVSILSLTLEAYYAFKDKPAYLHDWHGVVIILLSLSVLAIYCAGLYSTSVFRRHEPWPPPLRRSLPYWFSVYLGVSLLALINANFVWCFFIVFGLCFPLFSSRRLVLMVCIVFVSMCAYLGLFSWPVTGGQLGGFFSLGVSIFSFTAFAMLVQHLISEQFERNQLILQLSQANTELEEAHRRLSESAMQEQELAVLRERTRLAREMHDTLGHALVLISIKLEAAQRLRQRDPERCDRELESTKEIARTSMKELRASIANLRSPALELEPACRAISRYAREMAQRTGLRVSYDLHPDIEGLPEPVEETLWKVGQEALTNVEKHAHAQNVVLHISRRGDHVLMRVQDDGVGLPQELWQEHEDGQITCTSPEGHYGLSGMFERVESIGGHLYLRPGAERGTSVEVELPLVEALLPSLSS